ncbi:Unannotated, partial [Lentimonas sp. CC10]
MNLSLTHARIETASRIPLQKNLIIRSGLAKPFRTHEPKPHTRTDRN